MTDMEKDENIKKKLPSFLSAFGAGAARRNEIASALLTALSTCDITIEEARDALRTAESAMGRIPLNWNAEAMRENLSLVHYCARGF